MSLALRPSQATSEEQTIFLHIILEVHKLTTFVNLVLFDTNSN